MVRKNVVLTRAISLLTAITVLASYGFVGIASESLSKTEASSQSKQAQGSLKYYSDVYASYNFNAGYDSQSVLLDLGKLTDLENKAKTTEKFGGKDVIRWENAEDGFRLPFYVNEGLYTLRFEYAPLSNTTGDIIRSIEFDGKAAFIEMNNIKLKRRWVPGSSNSFDSNGDERNASLIQKEDFLTQDACDIYGLYSSPLVFYLSKGSHVLDLTYISGSAAFSKIELIPVKQIIDYGTYRTQNAAEDYNGEPIRVQGEAFTCVSDRTLTALSINDPTMSPFEFGVKRMNAIGGWNWRNGNEEITWTVTVPQNGYYKLALRYKQDYNNLVVYRQLKIDGTVPFREMEAYPFYTHNQYSPDVLSRDEPYLFYLTKGKHEISLSIVTGGLTSIINRLQELSRNISDTVREIQTITGINPDPNFDYELDKKMPWLLETLRGYSSSIKDMATQLKQLCGGNPPIVSTLLSDADKLDRMIKKPTVIPQKTADISIVQGNLADHSTTLKAQPLAVDYIELLAPSDKPLNIKASLWDSIKLQIVDFLQSFTKDYTISSDGMSSDSKVINVWVSRGREWGEAIQRMADEEFTPKYHVKVNVNILPPGYTTVINGASPLLLSIVSGTEPDVAMGSDMDTPIELAIRNSLVDLSKFEDFSAVTDRFSSAAVDPFRYHGGAYGLPETMDFPLLIYRKDVFEQYGISIPQTWEELWTYTIPKLKQINANFYMNSQPEMAVNTAKLANFATFLFQSGGSFYHKDGSSALDSDAANKAFYDWTKSFVQYQSPQAANFYNEMRTGTLPMGIGFMADYLMLDIAAPELYGRIGIAPIPGTVNEKGEIVRYGAGSVSSAIMFKKCTNKSEAWEFMKWWTQASTQERFSSEIEAKVGPTARWFSANLEAFYSLPWGKENAQIIKEWMPWYKNAANTLGGYMTPRAVNNAWTRTVMSGMKPMDSLEQAFREISIQIQRKQKEYGGEMNG